MKVKEIVTYIFVGLVLFACGEGEQEQIAGDQVDIQTSGNDNYSIVNHGNDEVLFKGGLIELEREGGFEIQAISQQRQDVYFKAKRIPTELYLTNQGVEPDEMVDALDKVAGEQLFYFEFEEDQKQDLMKKYYSGNMDAGVTYMSFEIAKDFYLVTSAGDTIQSDYTLYERNFHVAPYERLLVSFSGVDQNEEVQLIYSDKLFGKGELDFNFASTHYLENNYYAFKN